MAAATARGRALQEVLKLRNLRGQRRKHRDCAPQTEAHQRPEHWRKTAKSDDQAYSPPAIYCRYLAVLSITPLNPIPVTTPFLSWTT